MGYTERGAGPIDAGRAAGLRNQHVTAPTPHDPVLTIGCPAILKSDTPAEVLANMIEALDRKYGLDTLTICLEMLDGGVPDYVVEGIRQLGRNVYTVKIIVIAGNASSHLPGPLLDHEVREAVSQVRARGMLWHPLQNCRVPSDPLDPAAAEI